MNIDNIFQLIRLKNNKEFLDIVDNIDVDIIDPYNWDSLLHQAVVVDNYELALELIQKWIKVNHQNKLWNSVLHYLWDYFFEKTAKLILENWWDVNIINKHWNNALWTAAFNSKWRYYELTKLYMEYGWDPNHVNNYGKSPLSLAKEIWDKKLIDILEWKNSNFIK